MPYKSSTLDGTRLLQIQQKPILSTISGFISFSDEPSKKIDFNCDNFVTLLGYFEHCFIGYIGYYKDRIFTFNRDVNTVDLNYEKRVKEIDFLGKTPPFEKNT